jgi:nucleoside-diphosphate-sugar epimerase
MADCFVTGGTGFIGHHIVKQLNEEQHDITVLIREDSSQELLEGLDYQTVVGDVTNLESLLEGVPNDTQWLFHNAAVMADWGGKEHYFPVNVGGTENILEVIRRKEIPQLMHTSSTAVYGFPEISESIPEDYEKNPANAYQESKLASEELIHEYIADYGIGASMIRPPVVLGEGDMFTGPQFIERIENGNMVVFGNGSNEQSFVHADDVARALVKAAENFKSAKNEAFNVTSFNCEFRELMTAIAEELGVEPSFREIPYGLAKAVGGFLGSLYRAFGRDNAPLLTSFRAKMFGSEYLIDDSKIREKIGFSPKWDLESTVRDMVEWRGFVKPR